MLVTTDQIKNQFIPRIKKEIQNSTSTDTAVALSGLKVHIGNNPPDDDSQIWIDTSAYD